MPSPNRICGKTWRSSKNTTFRSAFSALRAEGFLGRWSETLFVAIVGNCAGADLARAAQNVHTMANCSGVQWWDDQLSVSVSVGRAIVQPGDTVESLLERASRDLGNDSHSATALSSGGQPGKES